MLAVRKNVERFGRKRRYECQTALLEALFELAVGLLDQLHKVNLDGINLHIAGRSLACLYEILGQRF